MRVIKHDVPLKVSKAKALDEARMLLRKMKGRPIRDRVGRIGYDMGEFILVAKTEATGAVSCHEDLFKLAKPLVMFLQDSKHFYRFELADIKADPETFMNHRGFARMRNFKLGLGKRWESNQISLPIKKKVKKSDEKKDWF